MAAETSSAATILLSSHFGYPLFTTNVVTGSAPAAESVNPVQKLSLVR